MSYRSHSHATQAGFSVVELLITLTLAVLIGIIFFTFFKTSMVQYLNVQKDGSSVTTLSLQSARVANVVRGLTGITMAKDNELTIYAYFYPSDAYVSQLHYYVSNGQLLADLTSMTANPPTGTLVTGSTKTFVVIPALYQASGSTLFTYYDSGAVALATPVSDTNAIKSIQINLATTLAAGGNQNMSVNVSLRNRKTNL